MSKSAFTVKAFGIYVLVVGLGLVCVPHLLLPILGFAPSSEIWIRVVGLLAFNIGIYYWYAAKSEARAFFMATVFTRVLVPVVFIVFVVLGLASSALIPFGAADFAGAAWTFLALRSERPGAGA